MPRILTAFDKCKDSLTALECCRVVKRTLEEIDRSLNVEMVPLSDGGEGFVKILTHQAKGEFLSVQASDSLNREKSVLIGLCELGKLPESVAALLDLPRSGKIAVVEMAGIVGLADLKKEERNPWKTSTKGVGEVLRYCASLEPDAILLGIGGSATNDLGMGALSALGLEITDRSSSRICFPSPERWSRISKLNAADLQKLPPLKIACDVRNPLLGTNGATHQYGGQKGLSEEDHNLMEAELKSMVLRLGEILPQAEETVKVPGSGAAGGIGYGLGLCYEVSLISGFELLRIWFDLDRKVGNCDYLITGEGKFDKTSMEGKAPFEMAGMAEKFSRTSYLFAGFVDEEAKRICQKKFSNLHIHEFGDRRLNLEENLLGGKERLMLKVREVFKNLPL